MDAPGSLSTPRLIVGLGNPGEQYRNTRHNVGFMVLDEVARRMGAAFQPEKRWNCHLARSGATWLLKPQTFMNLSGDAVAAVSHFYKLTPQETLVVYDDVDLSLGTLRLRPAGSAGGHNGMRSIIGRLGTDAFPRLKLFTGRSDPAGRDEQFERFFLFLLDANPFSPSIRAYEVNDENKQVDLDVALDELIELIGERNFDLYDGTDGTITKL